MEKLLKWVNGLPKVKALMRFFSYFVTLLSLFDFGFMAARFYNMGITSFAMYFAVLGVPFAVVSIVRKLINAPRPYEMDDFMGERPKHKGGCSFPSRHAFSAFAIGTLCLFVNPLLGALTLLFAALMCFSRVALGIHFVRDVVCGASIGILTSLVGALILI